MLATNSGLQWLEELVQHCKRTNRSPRFIGEVTVRLFDEHGRLKYEGSTSNLVTDKGDAFFAAVARGGTLGTFGMKLGTATTAASKTYDNAGAYIAAADYISGSAAAMAATFPKQGASVNIAQYQCSWAAGTATNATINRVALVDNTTDAGETDGTHTWAIALLPDRPINKGSNDTLQVTWNIAFLGA